MSDLHESTPLLPGKLFRKKKSIKFLSAAVFLLIIGELVLILTKTGFLTSIHTNMPSIGKSLKLRIYTNNIRFDNHNPDQYEKRWHERKHQVTASINFNTNSGYANVVCLQEVLHNQLEDILFNLNNEGTTDDWSYFGVGRTDGKQEGEYVPILYKNDEWLLIHNRTFWLSETPAKPSRGWDAVLERIVTMVTLQSKENPLIKLNFFNTHFDHRGKEARKHSSRLIINKMRNYNPYPSFLCGDFNTEPTAAPYKILTEAGFKDSRVLIDKLHKYGHEATFTGFDHSQSATSIIDYIWAPYFSKNGNQLTSIEEIPDINYYDSDTHEKYKIEIKSFGVLENYFHDYHFSDHRPVSADFEVSYPFPI